MSGTIKYQFTGFTFNPNEHKLESAEGKTVTLTPITCDLLRVFVENRGSLLSVDDLIKEVWPGKIEEVENGNVTRQISFLRKALKHISKKSNHIVNVKTSGYTLAAEFEIIEPIDNHTLSVVNDSQTSSRNAEIWERITKLEDAVRLIDAKINYLASWINLMWEAIPKPKRAEIIYNQVRLANQKLIGPEQDIQINTLEGLADRIDDVFSIHQQTSSIRELELAIELSSFWNLRGYWSNGCDRLQDALSRHPEAAPDLQALGYACLGALFNCQDNNDAAERMAMRSIKLSRQTGNDESLARSLFTLGAVAEAKGHYAQAKSRYLECLKFFHPIKSGWLISKVFRELGRVAEAQEYYDSAEQWYLKSLTQREKLGDAQGIAQIRNYLGSILIRKKDYKQGRVMVDESIPSSNKFNLAYCYTNLGLIEEDSKQYRASYNYFSEALTIRQEIGDRRGQARAIEGMARVTEKMNNDREAAGLYGSAYQIRTVISAPLTPAERKDYGSNSLSLRKKYPAIFEKGSERLAGMMIPQREA